MWTFRALPKVGVQLTQENAGRLPELIEEVLPDDAVKVTIEENADGTRSVKL